jgi:hypothetical protein
MPSIMRFALVALLLCVPFAFADAGPSPAPPKVIVHLVKNGQPEASVTEITYHCMGTADTNTSNAVEPYPVKFACSGGKCTNEEWYYKFNPCFSFPEGYFSYVLDGKAVRTGTFNTTDKYDNYEMTIDAPTGQVTSSVGTSGSCLPALLLPAILLGSVFWSGGFGFRNVGKE